MRSFLSKSECIRFAQFKYTLCQNSSLSNSVQVIGLPETVFKT